MNVVQFIDENIKLNEKGKPWALSEYQRTVLNSMFERDYSIRLWSEPKKSGKTFVSGCVALAETYSNPDCENILVANDSEQAESRVYRTCYQLIKHNPGLTSSAKVLTSEIRLSNGSLIRWVA